jgi:hypothetical protein
MGVIKYLDERGLNTLIQEIRSITAKTYKVKGSAVYADAAYLVNPDKHQGIDSVGLWKLIDGVWTKITTFEVGWIYNIENSFITDSDFIDGAGIDVAAGSNICVCEATGTPPTYKWDLVGNAIDLSDYQTRKFDVPYAMFTSQTPVTYTSVSQLPTSEAKATATITENMITILASSGTPMPSDGDVYQAHVTEDPNNSTMNVISWTKLGNQTNVEGMLELLSNVAPNTAITNAEILAMFNS